MFSIQCKIIIQDGLFSEVVAASDHVSDVSVVSLVNWPQTFQVLQLRIVDEIDEVVDIGVDGEIQYKSVFFFKTYEKQEDLYEKFLTDDGWFFTHRENCVNC